MIVRCWVAQGKIQFPKGIKAGLLVSWYPAFRAFGSDPLNGGPVLRCHPDGSADIQFTKDCVIPYAVVWAHENVPGDLTITMSTAPTFVFSKALSSADVRQLFDRYLNAKYGNNEKSATRNSLGHLLCDTCGNANEYAEPAADGGYTCRGCKMQREMWT